jgi:hypothetical protein
MVDSDWVDGGSVVIGEQGPLVLDLELPVAPDGGGQGEQALADADEDSAEGAAMVLFQAELVLRVLMTDSIHWRIPPSEPNRRGSSLRSGRMRRAPNAPRWRSKAGGGVSGAV